MKTVASILHTKGHDVVSVAPTATVYEALQVMAEHNVGAVIVMEDDRLVGIISERDYARKVILLDRSSKVTPVSEIMTSRVVVVHPENTAEECLALMTDKHIRHLPVADGDEIVGIVSIGDVVKAMISEQELIIEQLERYITGGG